MLRKYLLNTLLRNLAVHKLQVRHSALFVNGSKASETYVFITPQIDYPNINKEQSKIEIKKRQSTFEFDKLEDVWAMYEELKQRRNDYEIKKSEISTQISKLMKENPESNEVNKLKIKLNLFKENIRILKHPFWSAETAAMLEALKLPNKLHPLTAEKDKILYSHLSCPNSNKNHLVIGKELDIITFKKNENYYLHGDAAIFELGAKFALSKKLKERSYIQFSNTDFVKSVVIEGCGEDHTNPNSTFILQHNEDSEANVDNRLHLTGAGSLTSFFAYHAKNVVYAKVLPIKYYALGRQYSPSPSDEDSLFHVSQSSVLQLFEAVRDETEQESLDEIVNIVKEFYTELGYHFRLNIQPAHKLLMWESLRITIEMFSASLKDYVEVGNVSLSSDFLSKRLMFTYTDKNESKFPYIISGTLLNVPKLLGCVLEQDGDFTVPDKFQVKNWSV